MFESCYVFVSFDSLNRVQTPYHPYFLRTFYPIHSAIHHYPNYPPVQWISLVPPVHNPIINPLLACSPVLFGFSIPLPHPRKRQMYASRSCSVPTSPLLRLLFEQRPLQLSTKMLKPDRQQDTHHSTTAFADSNGDFVGQVREQRLSGAARARRTPGVCVREDLNFRFATGM